MTQVLQPAWVETLRGHTLAFTGKVFIDGEWEYRENCVLMAKSRGANGWKTDMSGKVTLLIHGDLASQRVSDTTRNYSKKLRLADTLRRSGKAIALIDGHGFADLINGYPARNRELLVASPTEVLVLPQIGERILGGPLATKILTAHRPSQLTVDLGALDRGTAAHEATVAAMSRSLEQRGLVPERSGRHAPEFDLGWIYRGAVHIAEVKSPGSTVESQQIRLGLGQVLEYAQQIRAIVDPTQLVQPVLVLEREPKESHWVEASKAAGVVLTWGPNFSW